MKALHNIKVGTRFKGNIDGGVYKVVGITPTRDAKYAAAIIQDEKTEKKHYIGLEALKRYLITIIE